MCVETDRLDNCAKALAEMGYEDVKFFYGPTGKTLSEAATEAADLLQAIVQDRKDAFAPFNDVRR